MDFYLEKKSKGQIMSNADIKSAWRKARTEGKEKAKDAKAEVMAKKDTL